MAPQALAKSRRRVPVVEPTEVSAQANPPGVVAPTRAEASANASAELAVARFLRSFQVLLLSARLYQKNHPRVMENLEAAEKRLRRAHEFFSPLHVTVERGRLVVPLPGLDAPSGELADQHGELGTLAEELSRCGIASIDFLPHTNLGELDKLAYLLNSAPEKTGPIPPLGGGKRPAKPAPVPSWPARLAEQHITGIVMNTPLERRVDAALASFVAALVACSGANTGDAAGPNIAEVPANQMGHAPAPAPTPEELHATLHLLARIIPALETARESSPQEAARDFHAMLAEADSKVVSLLVGILGRAAPSDGEAAQTYIARLVDILILESANAEFRAERLNPPELRRFFARLAAEMAGADGPVTAFRKTANQAHGQSWSEALSLSGRWTDESYAESLHDRFWSELPQRDRLRVLRGRSAWCVPVQVVRHTLKHLAASGPDPGAQEARQIVLNFARCLEGEGGRARRDVATGLVELESLIEHLWLHQLPEELTQGVVRALLAETSPDIAALLAACTEDLARLAVTRSDFAEFERILQGLERAPRDVQHAHLASLAARLVADESWLLLVDASLTNRPLDPALPRLLRRDTERLLDRLTLLLTAASGQDALPAMARLVRVVGEPAFSALEIRLFESRRQRAAAAVKLLAASQPERLIASLPRALARWDWRLQDLAVAELVRTNAEGTAWAFLACVNDAHHLVVPMMLDQIGMAREIAAVPLLLEIAAGENMRLRDVFLRIKAVEALGRMRAVEAAPLLRALLRVRNGLTFAEPAGLRAAAEETLALLENRPSSAQIRAEQEAMEKISLSYGRPRRYLRVPLEAPFQAQIEGPQSSPARVRAISLGGAFLESNRRLAIGDSIHLEIRAGFRTISSTAVVRNVTPQGGGVEFVHMKEEDREKLRRLVRRLLRP